MIEQFNGYATAAFTAFIMGASPSSDLPPLVDTSTHSGFSPIGSETIEEPLCHARGQISLVADEASSPDWDGDGAEAVPFSASVFASMLTNQLVPFCQIVPDVAPEADGSIELNWHRNKSWRLVVSVDGNGKVFYAAWYGDSVQTGHIDRIDEVSIDVLRRILFEIYA